MPLGPGCKEDEASGLLFLYPDQAAVSLQMGSVSSLVEHITGISDYLDERFLGFQPTCFYFILFL